MKSLGLKLPTSRSTASRWRSVRSALFALSLVACGSSKESDPVTTQNGNNAGSGNDPTGTGGIGGDGGSTGLPAGNDTDAGQSNPDVTIGTFNVELVAALPAVGDSTGSDAFTSMIGKVSTGPAPQGVIWEASDMQGDCALLVPRIPFCDPACGGGAVCVEDGQCTDYPTALDVGSVTVQGLHVDDGSTEFTMQPIGAARAYQPVGLSFEYPPFADGDPLHLAASGNDTSAFDIDGQGIAPLEVLTADGVPFARDQAVTLEWVPGATATAARVQVVVDISHHGGQTGEIDCDTSDSGSLEISADLVTQLLDLSYAGFPSLKITRVKTGSSSIAQGRVEFRTLSSSVLNIEIEGLTSCMDVGTSTECPDGQTCLQNHTCG
jgi:hypothetical protein